jgi:HEPN domain-containing protein
VPPHDDTDSGTPADWLRRAHSSYALAQVAKPEATCWEDLCFQAQQAAEKAIKAVMLHRDVRFAYVHDLGRLLAELEEGSLRHAIQTMKKYEPEAFAALMAYVEQRKAERAQLAMK